MDETNVSTPDTTPTTPDVGSSTNDETAASSAPTTPDVDRTISYKFNHNDEVLDLSKEEDRKKASEWLREGRYFVEKGKEKLSSLENDEGYKWLQGIAKQYGMSTSDLAKKHGGEIENSIVKEYAEANDLPEDKAKKELKDSVEFQQLKKELDELKSKSENERRINEEIDNVVKAGYKMSDVTDDVLDIAKDRKIPLVVALELSQAQESKTRISELEKKLGIKETNDKNADSSMGKVNGAEYEGELTEELIKSKGSEWRKRNMPRILKWMAGKEKRGD